MATVQDIKNDSNYIIVHEHGFVGLVDHMGDDSSICQAARVSYGKGTKSVSDDRGLIRYLLRHHHTTPLEMCEIKFHMKLPIFVARQLVRHRTANINEYSGRYSEMPDEFYVPAEDYLQPQSTTNRQGRSGEFDSESRSWFKLLMKRCFEFCYNDYKDMIETCDHRPGLAKELSRIVLPVANYTEWFWKIDLHNLFHFLKLRLDPHAQREIRDFADAIYKLIQPLYPIACEAFEDYIRQSKTLSRMEITLIKELVWSGYHPSEKEFILKKATDLGMSKREIDEFIEFWIS